MGEFWILDFGLGMGHGAWGIEKFSPVSPSPRPPVSILKVTPLKATWYEIWRGDS